MIRKDFEIKISSVHPLVPGRVLIIKTEIKNQKVILVNIYAPNEADNTFFQTILQGLFVPFAHVGSSDPVIHRKTC